MFTTLSCKNKYFEDCFISLVKKLANNFAINISEDFLLTSVGVELQLMLKCCETLLSKKFRSTNSKSKRKQETITVVDWVIR